MRRFPRLLRAADLSFCVDLGRKRKRKKRTTQFVPTDLCVPIETAGSAGRKWRKREHYNVCAYLIMLFFTFRFLETKQDRASNLTNPFWKRERECPSLAGQFSQIGCETRFIWKGRERGRHKNGVLETPRHSDEKFQEDYQERGRTGTYWNSTGRERERKRPFCHLDHR